MNRPEMLWSSEEQRNLEMQMNLSEEEKIVLKLFRECNQAMFCRYECEVAEAQAFAGILGENVERKERKGYGWVGSDRGKINVAAFLKD